MYKAVIFDMDGVIINSEPLWKRAEAAVFTSLGVPVTEAHADITAKMTTKAVTKYWHNLHPWHAKSLDEVENEVINMVGRLIEEEGEAIDGVTEVLNFFTQRQFKIGLATNAPARLISMVLEKFNIAAYFDVCVSSEFEDYGKPAPDVFLTAARQLQVLSYQCIVIEDSSSGIEAASKAGMKTVALIDHHEFQHAKFALADVQLHSLLDFNEEHLDLLK